MELTQTLKLMLDAGASDVYIVAGLPLTYGAGGRQHRLETGALTPADTKRLVEEIYRLANRDITVFEDNHNHDDDFSFAIPGVGRFIRAKGNITLY